MKLPEVLRKTASSTPDLEVNECFIISRLVQDYGSMKKNSYFIMSNIECENMDHTFTVLREVLDQYDDGKMSGVNKLNITN